ncbi:enoyl-CoA delta isomerase 1, mitochondrial-like [Sycon ciliatum]|uniref:enoyl-CoA delta isomerase 1, mitochondrial-like n=1 Tax=Sycon ciliatum TaxID=27933 RepID=UPI0031F6C9AC
MAFLGSRLLPRVCRANGNGLLGSLRLASSKEFVSVEKREDKIAVVSLNRAPVNALNYPLLSELANTFTELEDDRAVKSIIVASNVPGIYSAGLDILEMYQATDESARRFWKSLQDMWLSLYACTKPTVAAINGASPAGGCLIACACDYRVMAESNKYTIGLNETKLSIVAPFWFMDTYVATIGQRSAERALILGSLFSPTDALKIGLVDEVVASDQVMERATAECLQHMKIPNAARVMTKRQVREHIVERFEAGRENDVDMFAAFVLQDSVQAGLGRYLEALKAKSK